MPEADQGDTPLEIVQVALVVRDLEATIRKITALWVVAPFTIKNIDIPEAVYHGKKARLKARAAFVKAGPIDLEIVEPEEGDNIYWEFLCEKGEGVHHLKIPVLDFEKELAFMRGKGIEALQIIEGRQANYAFLDTRHIMGVIVEIVQRK